MRRFPALVLACLLALAGCGSGSSPAGDSGPATPATSATSTPPSDSASGEGTSSAAPATPDVRRDDAQQGAAFATPSGNITCFVDTGRGEEKVPATTGCTIAMKSWTAPKSTCTLAYGDQIAFSAAKSAHFTCRGDVASCFVPVVTEPDACGSGADGLWWHQAADGTVMLPDTDGAEGAVLPYDTAVRIGSVECTSRKSGVTCADSASGHGFTISREAYTLTPSG